MSINLRFVHACLGTDLLPCQPDDRPPTISCLGGETAVYCHFIFLGLIAIAALNTAPEARAADSARCQQLSRRFENARAQVRAIEVSLTLCSAVDADCIALATELLDYGASLEARDG